MSTRNLVILLLIILIFFSLVSLSCTKSPTAEIPSTGTGNNNGGNGDKDSTGNGSGSGSGGGNSGNNTGVTLMRGTSATAFYYSHATDGRLKRYNSEELFVSGVKLTFDSSAAIRIKLVNSDLGTFTAKAETNGFNYTHYDIYFTNINHYTNGEKAAKPDTAGKLQIWIYRDDGQNIIPASGGHPAVKRIIQVPGTFPNEPEGYGIIMLKDYDYAGYPVRPPAVTLSVLKEIFSSSRWKVENFFWQW